MPLAYPLVELKPWPLNCMGGAVKIFCISVLQAEQIGGSIFLFTPATIVTMRWHLPHL